ncbi:MAG: hypothetical protein IJB85_06480 [Clostridia bacterium]|nr:hypothetical protein [Clostridia bacterium]
MSRKDALHRVRSQVLLVRGINNQMKGYARDGLHSLRVDGMPRATGGVCRGLDVQIEKRDAMERMLRRESERLHAYEEEARRWMDGMRPEHYAFCAMYYIGGFTMEETAEAIDRSLRQCARYKREIEAA